MGEFMSRTTNPANKKIPARERGGDKKSIPRKQNGEPRPKALLFLPQNSITDNEINYAAKI